MGEVARIFVRGERAESSGRSPWFALNSVPRTSSGQFKAMSTEPKAIRSLATQTPARRYDIGQLSTSADSILAIGRTARAARRRAFHQTTEFACNLQSFADRFSLKYEPTVFIVDDDPSILDSLSALVVSMGLKTRLFSSGLEYLQQFDPQAAGVLVLDVHLPDISGFAIQARLAKEPLCLPIIVLTGRADVPIVIRAFREGAFEFLLKSGCESEFREAIQAAIASDSEFRHENARKTEICSRLAMLTAPEREVLDLVLSGVPNKTIASKLTVSRRAVEDRRSRLFKKLEVDTLPALVRLVADVGVRPDR